MVEGLGFELQLFFDMIVGGLLDCGYIYIKVKLMMVGEFLFLFLLNGVVKDSVFIVEVMQLVVVNLVLIDALYWCFCVVVDVGYAE